MVRILNLDPQTLQELVKSPYKHYSQSFWGGRQISFKGQTFSVNDLVYTIQKRFAISSQNKKEDDFKQLCVFVDGVKKIDKIFESIWNRDFEKSSVFGKITALVARFFGNLFFNRNNTLKNLEHFCAEEFRNVSKSKDNHSFNISLDHCPEKLDKLFSTYDFSSWLMTHVAQHTCEQEVQIVFKEYSSDSQPIAVGLDLYPTLKNDVFNLSITVSFDPKSIEKLEENAILVSLISAIHNPQIRWNG